MNEDEARGIRTEPAVEKVHRHSLSVASSADSSRLMAGETVLAIGNPPGITKTGTEGAGSALNRTAHEGQGAGVIRREVQTRARVNGI